MGVSSFSQKILSYGLPVVLVACSDKPESATKNQEKETPQSREIAEAISTQQTVKAHPPVSKFSPEEIEEMQKEFERSLHLGDASLYSIDALFDNAEDRKLKTYIFHYQDTDIEPELARDMFLTVLNLPQLRDSKASDQRIIPVLNLPEKEYEPKYRRMTNDFGHVEIRATGSMGERHEGAFVIKAPEFTKEQEKQIRGGIMPLFGMGFFAGIERFDSWFKEDGIRRKIPSEASHLIDYPPEAEKVLAPFKAEDFELK